MGRSRYDGEAAEQALLVAPGDGGSAPPAVVARGLFATERPSRDRFWSLLWALSLAGMVVGASYGWVHR
jgi:hypothetical protein